MTKATIRPQVASEQAGQLAAAPDEIRAGGKAVVIKRPGVLSQFRIVEIVGAKTARNEVYMDMIMPVLWVTHIDGEQVPEPQTKLELEALIQRLGEEAIVAIGRKLATIAASTESGDAVKK